MRYNKYWQIIMPPIFGFNVKATWCIVGFFLSTFFFSMQSCNADTKKKMCKKQNATHVIACQTNTIEYLIAIERDYHAHATRLSNNCFCCYFLIKITAVLIKLDINSKTCSINTI